MINNSNLSFLFGVLIIVSLFLTWIFDYSLIEISRVANYDITKWTLPKYMFVYMGFVFLVLGVISLLMNFENKIWMSKIVLYLVPLYFIIVCILNIPESTGDAGATGATMNKSEGSSDILNLLGKLGIGFYFFLISFVGLLIFLKVEKKKKKYNLQDSVAKTSGFKEDQKNYL